MNKSINWVHIGVILAIVFVNIGLDQVSKVVVRNNVELNEKIELVGDSFIMTKIENSGAFLSMGEDWSPWLRITMLLVIPSMVLLGLLFYLFIKTDLNGPTRWGYACVVGGGLANMFDRIAYGSVTDFLHIDLGFAKTGIFNIADVSIMVGIGLVLLGYWQERKEEKAIQKAS
jgi:signal peptidase II